MNTIMNLNGALRGKSAAEEAVSIRQLVFGPPLGQIVWEKKGKRGNVGQTAQVETMEDRTEKSQKLFRYSWVNGG